MLSLFPDLLDWSWYAPLLFRLFLGVYCLSIGWTIVHTATKKANNEEYFAWLCLRTLLMLLGGAFIFGIAVQALGAIGFALALFALYLRLKHSPHTTESIAFYLLIGLVSFSLILLGAGPHAVDLPL